MAELEYMLKKMKEESKDPFVHLSIMQHEELLNAVKERDELKKRVEELEGQHRVDTLAIELATKFINDDIENEKYIELGKATQWAFENDVDCVVVNGILMIVKDGWYDESVVDYWKREVNDETSANKG